MVSFTYKKYNARVSVKLTLIKKHFSYPMILNVVRSRSGLKVSKVRVLKKR
jgi:hypothetical protein